MQSQPEYHGLRSHQIAGFKVSDFKIFRTPLAPLRGYATRWVIASHFQKKSHPPPKNPGYAPVLSINSYHYIKVNGHVSLC